MFEEGAEVTVRGIVRAGELVTAPITGYPAVVAWTRVRVWDHLDAAGSLVDDFMISRVAAFVIETGATPVHVSQTTCMVERGHYDLWPHPWVATEILRLRNLERYARSTFFSQALVQHGEYITVRGVVTQEVDQASELGYRDNAVRTRLVGYPGRPLTISR